MKACSICGRPLRERDASCPNCSRSTETRPPTDAELKYGQREARPGGGELVYEAEGGFTVTYARGGSPSPEANQALRDLFRQHHREHLAKFGIDSPDETEE